MREQKPASSRSILAALTLGPVYASKPFDEGQGGPYRPRTKIDPGMRSLIEAGFVRLDVVEIPSDGTARFRWAYRLTEKGTLQLSMGGRTWTTQKS